MKLFDFEEARVKQFLKQNRAKQAAVQLPSGLRRYLPEIIETFDEAKVEILVLADSCYGACDLADVKAKQLGCDVLVHYGHADMGLPTSIPTLYVEARMLIDPSEVVESTLSSLDFKRVGLVTTVQHISYLPKVMALLHSHHISSIVGKQGSRSKHAGQVLGCDMSCARSIANSVDGFLYIGTGEFHPIGIALTTGKSVVVANPLTKGVNVISPKTKFLNQRRATISKAAACKRFGIVVSIKRGQARFELASKLIESFKCAGKTASILVVDEVQPEKIEDFGFEAYVCAACPRIPIDDAERFSVPVLTPFEAGVILGEERFEPYKLDEIMPEDFDRKFKTVK